MANVEDTVRQLRTAFLAQWSQQFPHTPTPAVRALDFLCAKDCEGKAGASFKERLSSGVVSQLASSLKATEDKIHQLQDQVRRKTFLYEFLYNVVQCLDTTGRGQTSPPIVSGSFNTVHTSSTDLPVTSASVNTRDSVTAPVCASTDSASPPARQLNDTPARQLNDTPTGQQYCLQPACINYESTPGTDTPHSRKDLPPTKQTTGLGQRFSEQRPVPRVARCQNCGHSYTGSVPEDLCLDPNLTSGTRLSQQTTFLPRPSHDLEGVTSEKCSQCGCVCGVGVLSTKCSECECNGDGILTHDTLTTRSCSKGNGSSVVTGESWAECAAGGVLTHDTVYGKTRRPCAQHLYTSTHTDTHTDTRIDIHTDTKSAVNTHITNTSEHPQTGIEANNHNQNNNNKHLGVKHNINKSNTSKHFDVKSRNHNTTCENRHLNKAEQGARRNSVQVTDSGTSHQNVPDKADLDPERPCPVTQGDQFEGTATVEGHEYSLLVCSSLQPHHHSVQGNSGSVGIAPSSLGRPEAGRDRCVQEGSGQHTQTSAQEGCHVDRDSFQQAGGRVSRCCQTDITICETDNWTEGSSTMFWNRKKSAPKRCDELRDRDNSGILGRHADSADLPPPPPPRTSSPQHVHFLKLTDGFNIVLDGGGAKPPPPPSSSTTTSRTRTTTHTGEESGEEERYDNNTTWSGYKTTGEKKTAWRSQGQNATGVSGVKQSEWQSLDQTSTDVSGVKQSTWQSLDQISTGVSGVKQSTWQSLDQISTGVSGVKQNYWGAPGDSGADEDEGYHTPVSRVRSDTTGWRTTPAPITRPQSHSPPLSRPISKPRSQPRKKPPPLPPKQKPTAVFYVDCDALKIPGGDAMGGGREGCSDSHDMHSNLDREVSVSDKTMGTCTGGSGRGHALRTQQAPHAMHTRPQPQSSPDSSHTPRADTRAGKVQPQLDPPRFAHNSQPDTTHLSERSDRSERLDHFRRSNRVVLESQREDFSQREDRVKNEDQFVGSTLSQGPDREQTRSEVVTTKPPPSSACSSSGEEGREEGFHPPTVRASPGRERRPVDKLQQLQNIGSRTTVQNIELPAQTPCNDHITQSQHKESRGQQQDIESTARLQHDNTQPQHHDSMSASRHLGIHDLCQSSVINAVEINQCLTTSTTTDKSAASSGGIGADSDSAAVNAMFVVNRHSVADTSDSDTSGIVGMYRKTDQPANKLSDNSREPEPPQPPHLAPTTAMENTTTSMTTSAHYHETDIDADPTKSTETTREAVLREKGHPPPLSPKKRPKQNTYENWTIDRIVTRGVDTTSEEDDDDDDDDDWDTGPSPDGTLKKVSTASGSKDSGLCVDEQGGSLGHSDSSRTQTPSQTTLTGEEEEERRRFSGGRISSIDELNRLHDDEDEYTTLSFRRTADTTTEQDDDNISIASDIVFIPGGRVSQSPEVQRHSVTEDHHGDHTPVSSSEDEQDSLPSADTSIDDVDGGETAVAPPSPRDNMLKMRHLLVTGILETERYYLEYLDVLIHYKRTLEASCQTSKPVINDEDIQAIFGNLHQLHDVHKEFVTGLQEKVSHWSHDQTVGDIFKLLVVMFPQFAQYAENYPSAVATIHRCSQESQQFQELAQHIVITSTLKARERLSLEGALFKPVQRMQRNTLVLYDLIKHTPEDHADFEMLQKALSLSQHNLENFGNPIVPGQKVDERRNLVKSSFLVELVSGWRKLRFIFLFSDLLVCTKMEQHRGGRVTFDCKWFIPMNALSLVTKRGYDDDMKFSKKDDIAEIKSKLRGLKLELKQETKKEESRDKHWSGISGIASSRHIEKLKKKIKELEGELILSSPKLPFKVWCDSVKPHTLLMTTDYEREEWREVLTSLRRKSLRMEMTPPSAFEVQEIVNSVKELPQVNKMGSLLTDTDEAAIYGTLNVTIHKLNGLRDACDTYCCLEMDSMGHFFMKARTRICSGSADPSWNEDFELELEGSQTLRILSYRKLPEKHGDVLLGRGALEMSKHWLKGTFQEKTVAMNEYSLVLSVRYTAAEQTMRRTPSRHSTAVFGVKISSCAKREGKTVPTIVTACVQEVEKRGLDEVGIYRVSGITSDVQKLKKHFDKNVKIGVHSLSEMPVHSATGLLKLYFRELPDPLFTEASYSNLLDALKLSDAEGKEKCMLSLLHNLPDVNYYTAVYLLEHLYRVSKDEKENKMTIHNLSTIFGPTLLAPAVKEMGATMTEMMSIGTEQCMKQSAVIYYFLNVLAKGGSLRRSSPT